MYKVLIQKALMYKGLMHKGLMHMATAYVVSGSKNIPMIHHFALKRCIIQF